MSETAQKLKGLPDEPDRQNSSRDSVQSIAALLPEVLARYLPPVALPVAIRSAHPSNQALTL